MRKQKSTVRTEGLAPPGSGRAEISTKERLVKATDFTRDDCQLGRKRIAYTRLERDYRCNNCGGRITTRWGEGGWRASCLACGSCDFIHEYEALRQRQEALEVLEGLPPELAEVLGHRHFTPLPLAEARELLNPPPIEI